MIDIKNLDVKVWEKEIMNNISLSFVTLKNYLVLGRNGSGKSSMTNFLMGNPVYEYQSGNIEIDGQNLLTLEADKRSNAGIFLSFQNVPEIIWVNLWEYLRIIYNNHLKNISPNTPVLSPFVFKRFIKKFLTDLEIDEKFLSRDLNVGFSGGEKRKIELLQASLLEPKYIILDEIDSGLDVDAFKVVSGLIKKIDTQKNSIIVITHHFKIIDYVNFDKVYVLKDGQLERSGGIELLEEIQQKGFE